MKKIIVCLFAFVASVSYSQEYVLSLFGSASEPSAFGLSIESTREKEDNKARSGILNIARTSMDYGSGIFEISGNGFLIDLGVRRYFKEEAKGFYSENFLTYGNVKFSEDFFGEKITGTYSYWSIINPNFGYRINLGNFVIDPSIGFNWKWEVKGKGVIDNKEINNLVFRGGVKVGYSF